MRQKLNGRFKTEWYRVKADLLPWKFVRKLKRGIQPHDVMPLLNKIFHKSFGNVAGNKKASAD